MKIEHEWQPWQLRSLGFSLPWWFVLAPALLRYGWSHTLSGYLPAQLEILVPFCYLLLALGVVSAFGTLGSPEDSCGSRMLARWFLLGVLSIPPGLIWFFFRH